MLQEDTLCLEAKALLSEAFAEEVGAEVTKTSCNIMHVALDYSKRLACVKEHQSESSKAHRVKWASLMKAQDPKKEDLRHMRFSDEVHFGLGPED